MCASPNCFHNNHGDLDQECIALGLAGAGSITIDVCESRKVWTRMAAILRYERKNMSVGEDWCLTVQQVDMS